MGSDDSSKPWRAARRGPGLGPGQGRALARDVGVWASRPHRHPRHPFLPIETVAIDSRRDHCKRVCSACCTQARCVLSQF